MRNAPTGIEIDEAYQRGYASFGAYDLSHVCPYRHDEHHPDLLRAWAKGFEHSKTANKKSYFDEVCAAMKMLADHGAVFMGQAVSDQGTAMSRTFRDVPRDQLVELPVFENVQLGMATGAALAGGLIVTCFPRINFLLEATSQLMQHLDKLPLYSDYRPKVIIRTAIATSDPLDPGPQHLGDYTDGLREILTTVQVVQIDRMEEIMPAYCKALTDPVSVCLVERLGMYGS